MAFFFAVYLGKFCSYSIVIYLIFLLLSWFCVLSSKAPYEMLIDEIALINITMIAITNSEAIRHAISPSDQNSLKIGFTTSVGFVLVNVEFFFANTEIILMLNM
jgi:hypothetical protein